MKYLTNDFRDSISPFFFSEHNGSYSALLNAGALYVEVFERGGYGWDAVADIYITEQLPQLKDLLSHDSEAGMFCLYSSDEKAIYEFLKKFSMYIKNEENFKDLMNRADYDEWD